MVLPSPATSGVTLADGIRIGCVVDGRSRRGGKKVNGALVQGFLYKDQLEPVAELNGAGVVSAVFVYGSRPHVPDLMLKGGRAYRILADHLGSPRLVIDTGTGEIVQRMDYDEYGKVILDTNPRFQPFGFAGGLYDPQTGLVRFGVRDYDPEVGRWTAKGPIGFGGGDGNLYQYVANDPVNFLDNLGLMKLPGDPTGLPPEWEYDPSHRYPNGDRYRHPSGDLLITIKNNLVCQAGEGGITGTIYQVATNRATIYGLVTKSQILPDNVVSRFRNSTSRPGWVWQLSPARFWKICLQAE